MGKVGLLDQPADPPPLPGNWSTLKWKKFRCLFCILDYSEHFNFSWIFHENVPFLGGFQVGTGEPPPLAWKLSQLWPNFSRFPVWGGPITLWIDEILPPHLCSVCFITFMDSCKANLVLGNFAKKLGFVQQRPKNAGGRVALPPGRFGSIRKIYGHGLLKTSLENKSKMYPDSSKYVRTVQDVSGQLKLCPDSPKCVRTG